jgi:hypothetical protein
MSKATKQWATVALLAAGLIVAVVTQPTPEVQTDIPEVTLALNVQPTIPSVAQAPTAVSSEITSRLELPRVEIEAWINHDPFESARMNRMLGPHDVALVQAIYGTGEAARALIGGSIFRVGTQLPDGRRVKRITPQGVEFGR